MDEIYDEMESRHSLKIKSEGFTFDPILNNEIIPRKCLAIFCENPIFEFSEDLINLTEKIRKESPPSTHASNESSSFYCEYLPNNTNPEKGNLHWTFLQVLKFNFEEEEKITKFLLEEYFTILKEVFSEIPPFEIIYDRIITTTGGVVMCGHPSEGVNINELRESYRKKIKERSLPFSEPYFNNIFHSTLFRFTSLPPKNFFINSRGYFGKCKVNSLTLGYGTWKLNPNEIHSPKLNFQPLVLDLSNMR